VVSTTVLLLPEFLPDLVEDDAVVFSFNDLQAVLRTPHQRTLLKGVDLFLALDAIDLAMTGKI
jgi:hypothetical protein